MATVSSSSSVAVILPERSPTATCDSSLLPQAVAALNLQKTSPRERTPYTGNSSSEANASSGIDSGYASAVPTPVKGTPENAGTPQTSHTFRDAQPEDGRRFIWPRTSKITKARTFDKHIPQLTQNRFQDLTELFSKNLIDYLVKEKVDVVATRNISIKLKCLGEDEATAKPCVIVLCNASASKKVKKYFNRTSVKSQYQPRHPSPESPYLEVVVWNRPPRLIASVVDIYSPSVAYKPALFALGGTPIKVCHSDITRFATLGGIVMVMTHVGTISLYGMSAGHIIVQEEPEDGSRDGEIDDEAVTISEDHDDNNDSGDEDDDVSDSEGFELDVAFEQDHADIAKTLTRRLSTVIEDRDNPWQKIGHVRKSSQSKNMLHGSPNFDWSLIDIGSLLDPTSQLLGEARNNRQVRCYKGKGLECDRPVMAFCGMSGQKKGMLSATMSYLAIAPSEKFVKTYNLTLTDGTGEPLTPKSRHSANFVSPETVLQDGDCGSWVVDTETDEVYGHVVAADDFGEAQVIPLNETLQDMRLQLSAASVTIPTPEDIRNCRRQSCLQPICEPDILASYVGLRHTPLVRQDAQTDSGYSSLETSPAPSSSNSPMRREDILKTPVFFKSSEGRKGLKEPITPEYPEDHSIFSRHKTLSLCFDSEESDVDYY